MKQTRDLDLICLGRSCVDFYGEQVGCGLERTSSFRKYVGGCATNIAVGTARLGLRSALLTRVGDEQLGRFVVDTLKAEGVDTSRITVDPERLTALVILGIRDRDSFPHIFYRTDCADMAMEAAHIDPGYLASSRALLVTGTHFSQPGVAGASRAAIDYAREAGTEVILDVDYRPVLWGLAGHAEGEDRFIESAPITAVMQSILPDCSLIVGTAEEIHIAGGDTDTLSALRKIREISAAPIVLKRGPAGCAVFPEAIPNRVEDAIVCPGSPVEVFNTLGAGDGFMSGFLRGWLADAPWETCGAYGNASGAIVVSRHGCSPASPSWEELSDYLNSGAKTARLRDDARLVHLHRATTRTNDWPEVTALAFDHRSQLEELAEKSRVPRERIAEFKEIIAHGAEAALRPNGDPNGAPNGAGAIVDGRYGAAVLLRFTDAGKWLARPIEKPGSRPLEFECGANLSKELRTWPINQIVKCLVIYHPDDPAGLRRQQEDALRELYGACVDSGHELLVEIIPPENSVVDDGTLARAVTAIYDAGVFADWWKLPPQETSAAWERLSEVIDTRDPYCRGVVLLGLNASEAELEKGFAVAAKHDICKGFAVGRSIFQATAEGWFRGDIDDQSAIDTIAGKYRRIVELWRAQRSAI